MMVSSGFSALKTNSSNPIENRSGKQLTTKGQHTVQCDIRAYHNQPRPTRKTPKSGTARIHNPLESIKLRQLLGHIHPEPSSLYPIDAQNINVAAKQLIQLGNALLDLQEEHSKWPVDPKRDTYIPSHLVIYREETLREREAGIYWTPSKIMRYIDTPNNTRRWLQRPWRDMADLTKDLAYKETNMNLKIPLHVAHILSQFISCSLNPDVFDLERSWKKGLTVLHNHIQGMGLIDWSKAERKALANTASRQGFNIRHDDELSDYVEDLFHMLEQVASGLNQAKADYPKAPIKLGITSKLPDGRQLFHDLSDLFPGGSLTAIRTITASDRQGLENLLNQTDSV